MNKVIKFYKSIPVFPQVIGTSELSRKAGMSIPLYNINTDAPLAENNNGKLCYPTERDKKTYLKKLKERYNA